MPSLVHPVLLRPDNFTPPRRTPWGGRRIADELKLGLLDGRNAGASVGESWEVSVEPDFPSVTEDGLSLDSLIRAAPIAWLGDAGARVPSTELLVKLLDAADDLSVQIHPADDYPSLEPGQGGKPESWYVVDAAPDACLYLGLAPGVDERTLRAALIEGADVSVLLTRVPVAAGDFFVIEPGTAHAIGRGCLIVEPQRITPGRKGVTYRFWDWNRRYDSVGNPDPSGVARALHVDHALRVARFEAPRGDAMLARIRRRPGPPDRTGAARMETLSGPEGPVISRDLAVARVGGTGELGLPSGLFRALTVIEGSVSVRAGSFTLDVPRGRSAALPASMAVELGLDRAHALVSAVP